MALTLTSNPPSNGPKFYITADARMPEVRVTATMPGQRIAPNAEFTWSATLVFDGARAPTVTPRGSTGKTEHPAIGPFVSARPSWHIPFSHVRGGALTVTVVMRVGHTKAQASQTWLIVGTNPSHAAIRTFANSIGADRVAFRKLMQHESRAEQFFRFNDWPKYSSDMKGGVGLCQLTEPKPTADQTWNWKQNVRGGWALYQKKEESARGFPGRVREGTRFRELVAAWNRARTKKGLPALPVDLPDYTPDQLERDTLRGFNGYAGGLHEYRLRRNSDDTLYVTVNTSGTRGAAEWRQVRPDERSGPGDRNYVENVLKKSDF